MKKCPTCNRSYSDDTQSFCLEDGTPLIASYDPDATLVIDPTRALDSSAPRRSNPALYVVIALLALLVGGGLVALLKSGNRAAQTSSTPTTEPSKPVTTVQREKTFVVVDECDTPCRMNVGTNQLIDTGLKPVLVKFNQRSEWFTLSGRPDDPIPAENFNSGEAYFASPKNAPSVRVQIKALR